VKKLLLTGIAALFLATGTAHAEMYIPQKYRGLWCSQSGTQYYRCDKRPDSEDNIEIRADRIRCRNGPWTERAVKVAVPR
jgi:hypothetical protein